MLGSGAHAQGGQSGLHLSDIAVSNGTMRWYDFNGQIQNIQLVGTSFASPAIMGMGIQAHHYEGWFSNLAFPQVLKAVLLASTIDANADGQIAINSYVWPSSSPTNDALDGAGQVDMSLVKQILDNNRYWKIDLTNSSFVSCGTGCREYTVGTTPAFLSTAASLRVGLAFLR